MVKAVYIHIPFCKDICTYCDFCKLYYNSSLVKKYLVVLREEIKQNYHHETINTLYIGGGTPSSLSLDELRQLLDIIKYFKTCNLEFTFECNIENIDEEKVKLLSSYGVNRLSIGVQTFNHRYLSFLNRKHTKQMVFDKIKMLKKYINNINVDLIYAIPGQTIDDVAYDLTNFLNLDIDHISTYSLMIEEHTILHNQKVMPISEELDAKMYELICHQLQDYEHYEISNFGKKKARHNLVYWHNEEYYGFGLGASGYIGNMRYTNTRSLNHYLEGKYVYTKEYLTFNETVENALILGFRLIDGINKKEFLEKYKIDLFKLEIIQKLLQSKQLLIHEDNIYINPDYLYVSNNILVNFMGVNYDKYV